MTHPVVRLLMVETKGASQKCSVWFQQVPRLPTRMKPNCCRDSAGLFASLEAPLKCPLTSIKAVQTSLIADSMKPSVQQQELQG